MSVPWWPTLNATLNLASAIFLVAGYIAIRSGKRRVHIGCMASALTASLLFFASYALYHYRVGTTSFGGTGWIRPVYFVILATHTVLAVVIIPLVIITLLRALRGRFALHKSIARWTLPLWLYVSVTGVVIYLMLYRLG